jgi:hypothetical protein
MTDTNKEREAAETWLRDRYGAYRGHFAWRELEEAFQAGRASLSANAGEPRKLAGDMFEFWWADHAPNATQEKAWAEWCSLMRPGPVVAAPPTAQAEGWRQIATAPKDGTYLLLWEQYSTNPFVGCWAFGAWTVSHEHVDAEGGWDGANVVDSISQERITHWMPLPAPPTSAEGVEHG